MSTLAVIVNGDGENFWIPYPTNELFEVVLERFKAEQGPGRKVSLVWEDFDWEEE